MRDQPTATAGQGQAAQEEDPLRGSTFLFDQSMSTATAHLEPSPQQSYVPFYGWWLSLRPRWNFDDHWRVQARLDYYKELTNSQETTLYREDVFGDIWTDLVYSTALADDGPWKNTKVSFGLRALWPTSKASQGEGVYVTTGATAGIRQKVWLEGQDAKALNAARFGLDVAYLHPFSSATTPNDYGTFAYVRENVDGYSFVSDQLTGQTLADHTLFGIFDFGLDVTPKLALSIDWILINQWHYAPTNACADAFPAPACPPRIDDNQFTQLGWFVVDAEYELLPELSIGLGYYNLANTVGPNGQANTLFGGGENNLLWSPDARVFLDLTANLDDIYEDASGKYRSKPGQTAAAAHAAHVQQVANTIH